MVCLRNLLSIKLQFLFMFCENTRFSSEFKMPRRRNSTSPTLEVTKMAYNKFCNLLEDAEDMILKMPHIFTILNQIVFFTLCDRTVGSDQKINSIYSLMLYNVMTYCLQYIRDLIAKQDWNLTIPVSEHSRVRHLAMSATHIVLEWTKMVTFLITAVFLVLSFSAKEGLDHYKPTYVYTFLTALYYLATEKVFFEMFPALLSILGLFPTMESLWGPVLLKSYTIISSACLVIIQIINKNYKLAACGAYINVILCWRDADKNCFQELRQELNVLGLFRDATAKELAGLDDVCSVCLCSMNSAKVTHCNHLFHSECLRRCFKTVNSCPLCKSSLIN